MKKIAIVYWSSTGHVEVLADSIYKGAKEAGAEVEIKLVGDAKVQDVLNADAVAFGSPSMDNNKIEQQQMEPFISEFKTYNVENKTTVLFGSFGWDDGKFMRDWMARMKDYGFNVIGEITVKEAPSEAEVNKAKELGRMLAK